MAEPVSDTPIYNELMDELEFDPKAAYKPTVFDTAAKRKHPARKRETPKPLFDRASDELVALDEL